MRAEYEWSRDLNFGATLLYKSDKAQDRKPRVGQETAKMMVFDVDMSFTLRPSFFTKAVDALPLIATDAASTIKVEGELAKSYPNPNVDDVAKLSLLLQNGGRYHGRQLLHAGRLAEALCRTDVIGLPAGEKGEFGEVTYYFSFNSLPCRFKDGRVRRIPISTGFGGNHWVLLPNGITVFRFCDANVYGVSSMVNVAESICPLK